MNSIAPVRRSAVYFHEDGSEFILPYEAVRHSSDPNRELLEFLQGTNEGRPISNAGTGRPWNERL